MKQKVTRFEGDTTYDLRCSCIPLLKPFVVMFSVKISHLVSSRNRCVTLQSVLQDSSTFSPTAFKSRTVKAIKHESIVFGSLSERAEDRYISPIYRAIKIAARFKVRIVAKSDD